MPRRLIVGLAIAGLGFLSGALFAAPERTVVLVGAATNLIHVLPALDGEFQRQNPSYAVRSTTAASGTLFAQIQHGAPYDVFLSADTDYPRQLAANGQGDAATYRIFARGRLVAWTTRPGIDPGDIGGWADNPAIKRIAIAQPRTAPYGLAAQRVLEGAGIWRQARGKVVMGENVAQAAQFVETGHAEVGLVGLSLVLASRTKQMTRWIEVPPAKFEGINLDHAAILTQVGAHKAAARHYLEFLLGPAAQSILRHAGYQTGNP